MGSLLEARGLSLQIGSAALLDAADLTIVSGEWVALAGPSGSGKSRLLAGLLGFEPGLTGNVRVDGRSPAARHWPPNGEYYDSIAAVFQENALLDELTVAENLEAAGATPERVRELLTRARLDPDADADKLPSALSGGMARRVALARALVRPPKLLVLDEPLAGVDPGTRDVLVAWLKEVRREHPNMAAIVVAHELDVLTGLCDRALVLRPTDRAMVDVPIEKLGTELESAAAASPHRPASPPPASLAEELRRQAREVGTALWEGVLLLPRLLLGLPAGMMHGRFVEFALRYGFLSLPFILIVNLIVGLSLVIQTESVLSPLRMSNRIPEAMARSVVQGFGPLLVALLMAGRAGSSQCSEVGMKRLSRQWEGLWLSGHDADRELFGPRAAALMIVLPVLVLVGEAAALFSGALYYILPGQSTLTVTFYLSDLVQQIAARDVAVGMLKGLLAGFGISLCAYVVGRRPPRSSEDIGQATTLATTLSAAAVIVIDFVVNLLV
ncbi:ABC transporter permease [bacterium]|nr:ABC transporter permease [bacterium]